MWSPLNKNVKFVKVVMLIKIFGYGENHIATIVKILGILKKFVHYKIMSKQIFPKSSKANLYYPCQVVLEQNNDVWFLDNKYKAIT